MNPVRRLGVLYIIFWAFPVTVFYLLGLRPSAWKELVGMQGHNLRNLTARVFLVMLPSQLLWSLMALLSVSKADFVSAIFICVLGVAVSWLLVVLYDLSLHGTKPSDHICMPVSRWELGVAVALTVITAGLFQCFVMTDRHNVLNLLTLVLVLAVPTGAQYVGMRIVAPRVEELEPTKQVG